MLGGLLSFLGKKSEPSGLDLRELKSNKRVKLGEAEKVKQDGNGDSSVFFQNASFTPSGKENVAVASSEKMKTRSNSKASSVGGGSNSPTKSVKKRRLKKGDAVDRELIKTRRRLSSM